MKIALVGDSDIERWPRTEYPATVVTVSGQSGATLSQIILPDLSEVQAVILCAGENDIGSPLWQSERALRDLLLQQRIQPRVYFLGPKLEPWLQDDPVMRRKYWQMHVSFQRIIRTELASRVRYIDCLFLFCCDDNNNNNKGAVYKATPNPIYFHADQLHLSREGYRVWKELLQAQLEEDW